jgi:hypothetical protein
MPQVSIKSFYLEDPAWPPAAPASRVPVTDPYGIRFQRSRVRSNVGRRMHRMIAVIEALWVYLGRIQVFLLKRPQLASARRR